MVTVPNVGHTTRQFHFDKVRPSHSCSAAQLTAMQHGTRERVFTHLRHCMWPPATLLLLLWLLMAALVWRMQVFGQGTSQSTLYELGIQPVVREVLAGFNCTIFAYGQTGTGAGRSCQTLRKRAHSPQQLRLQEGHGATAAAGHFQRVGQGSRDHEPGLLKSKRSCTAEAAAASA